MSKIKFLNTFILTELKQKSTKNTVKKAQYIDSSGPHQLIVVILTDVYLCKTQRNNTNRLLNK